MHFIVQMHTIYFDYIGIRRNAITFNPIVLFIPTKKKYPANKAISSRKGKEHSISFSTSSIILDAVRTSEEVGGKGNNSPKARLDKGSSIGKE